MVTAGEPSRMPLGRKGGFADAEVPTEEEAADEEPVMDAEPAAFVPGQLAAEAPGGGDPLAAASTSVTAPRAPAPINVAFPGQTGSRKHKKHKRRHH